MAGSVNKVILIGNLGADPEIRRTQDGRPIANLRIATSESWRDKATGERQERTEWHNVVIMNDRLADVAERFLKKGSKLYVEGSLHTQKWQDRQTGQDKYRTFVKAATMQMLDSRPQGAGNGSYHDDGAGTSYGGHFPSYDDAPPTGHSPRGQGHPAGQRQPPQRQQGQQRQAPPPQPADFDDDIPF